MSLNLIAGKCMNMHLHYHLFIIYSKLRHKFLELPTWKGVNIIKTTIFLSSPSVPAYTFINSFYPVKELGESHHILYQTHQNHRINKMSSITNPIIASLYPWKFLCITENCIKHSFFVQFFIFKMILSP